MKVHHRAHGDHTVGVTVEGQPVGSLGTPGPCQYTWKSRRCPPSPWAVLIYVGNWGRDCSFWIQSLKDLAVQVLRKHSSLLFCLLNKHISEASRNFSWWEKKLIFTPFTWLSLFFLDTLPFAWKIVLELKRPQQPKLGRAKSRSPGLPLGLLFEFRDTSIWAIFHRFHRHVLRELNSKWSCQDANSYSRGISSLQLCV